MKSIRWVLRFLGICIVAFAAGIVTGFIKNEIRNSNESVTEEFYENVQPVIVEEATVEYKAKEFEHYLVKCDEECIILAEVFDDGSTQTVESFTINKSVLPKEDVALLEDGMSFREKEEALMMIENFVS